MGFVGLGGEAQILLHLADGRVIDTEQFGILNRVAHVMACTRHRKFFAPRRGESQTKGGDDEGVGCLRTNNVICLSHASIRLQKIVDGSNKLSNVQPAARSAVSLGVYVKGDNFACQHLLDNARHEFGCVLLWPEYVHRTYDVYRHPEG